MLPVIATSTIPLTTVRPIQSRDATLRDRIAEDERVDVPEIQESYRVNLSDQAIAAAVQEKSDAARPRQDNTPDPGFSSAFTQAVLSYKKIQAL